jgi:hypothetical protein
LFSILDKQHVIKKKVVVEYTMKNIQHNDRNDCKSEAEAVSHQRVGLTPYCEVSQH